MIKTIVNLNKKKLVVTGASSGIGREVCVLLSQLNANVILIGRNEKELIKTINLMENKDNHRYYLYDLVNVDEISDLIKTIVVNDNKKLDGLVYCAGIASIVPINLIKYEMLDNIMRINYYSFIEMVKCFVEPNISDGGSIVAISSYGAEYGENCQTIYSASKACIDSSVKTLSVEVQKKLRINSIRPGFILTDMTKKFAQNALNDDFIIKQKNRQLLGEGKPLNIANMVVFLLSDAAKRITGKIFYVDGGRL